MSRTSRALAIVGLAALVLAACPDDVPDIVDDPPPEAPADDVDEPPEEAAPPEDDAAEVAVGSTELGEILVDGEGMTLYMFEPDEQGPSTCYDACAASWPPLLTDADPVAGDGADAGLLGTTERDDGSLQVTYDGWPLYYWAGDDAPGDTNGQGVQDVWWVLAADGTPIMNAPAGDTGAGTDDTGGDTGGADTSY